jgi:hypothetical protein
VCVIDRWTDGYVSCVRLRSDWTAIERARQDRTGVGVRLGSKCHFEWNLQWCHSFCNDTKSMHAQINITYICNTYYTCTSHIPPRKSPGPLPVPGRAARASLPPSAPAYVRTYICIHVYRITNAALASVGASCVASQQGCNHIHPPFPPNLSIHPPPSSSIHPPTPSIHPSIHPPTHLNTP